MKVATFNVNSIRARLQLVTEWMHQNQPDILAVQETKVPDEKFPKSAFDGMDYHIVFKGQKGYNGVAVFSKFPIENIEFGLDDDPKDEPRLIKAVINDIAIINTYIPQGYLPTSEKYRYKLQWFKRLKKFIAARYSKNDKVLWLGDLNVAPEDKDVHNPEMLLGSVCFNPDVTKALYDIKDLGFTDLFRLHNDQPGQFTYFDYRARNALKNNTGWRIDHIMATKKMAEICTKCYVDRKTRALPKPSDHAPLIAEFDM